MPQVHPQVHYYESDASSTAIQEAVWSGLILSVVQKQSPAQNERGILICTLNRIYQSFL